MKQAGLGDVRETGRVKINGLDMGLSWSVIFKLVIPRGVLKESNTLEMEVRNLSFQPFIIHFILVFYPIFTIFTFVY